MQNGEKFIAPKRRAVNKIYPKTNHVHLRQRFQDVDEARWREAPAVDVNIVRAPDADEFQRRAQPLNIRGSRSKWSMKAQPVTQRAVMGRFSVVGNNGSWSVDFTRLCVGR